MTIHRSLVVAAVFSSSAALASLTQGCAPQDSNASKFRDPIPQQGEAALDIAGSQVAQNSGGVTGQSLPIGAGVRTQGLGGAGTGAYASFYEFTRTTADGIDTATFEIVAAIAAVTAYPPTSVDDHEAVWGPGGDSLDPIDWRLTVTETASNEFDYEVDGRPHASTNDRDFQAIVTGHGYGHAHPSYRSGTLTVFGDVLKALDPTRSSGGTAKIAYDARAWPRAVTADLTTSDGTGQWYDAAVTHGSDGSGTLVLTALADIATPSEGKNENVDENSRWNASGAGRADVKMSGGDFGSTVVEASQCWSSSFAQTYYTDNVDYEPTAGEPSTCAFAQAVFNQ